MSKEFPEFLVFLHFRNGAAVEEGFRLWRKQQIEEQLRNFYQNRSQADIKFEKEWVEERQEQAIAAWEEFPGDESK